MPLARPGERINPSDLPFLTPFRPDRLRQCDRSASRVAAAKAVCAAVSVRQKAGDTCPERALKTHRSACKLLDLWPFSIRIRDKIPWMLLLESLPTVIGAAAIAPALLVLWLVIAADERPGPPAQVWIAFLLGAASISLLGIARAPFDAMLAVPGQSLDDAGLRSVFGVAVPEEIVKVLVIVAVSSAAADLRRSDGHRGLWRGRGPRLRGLRKPRLSRAACRDVAIAGGVAQRADRAVPRRARHHRRRLSCDRARRHRARRAPPSSRLGAHLELGPGAVRADRAACGVRFPAADAAEASGPRSRPRA